MLAESEKKHLRDKILSKKADFEGEDAGGQCLEKALDLYDNRRGGALYWVGDLPELGLDFGLHHAYFVPNESKPDESALNQEDNGFPEYPRLTVGEVKKIGVPQRISIVKEIVKASRR